MLVSLSESPTTWALNSSSTTTAQWSCGIKSVKLTLPSALYRPNLFGAPSTVDFLLLTYLHPLWHRNVSRLSPILTLTSLMVGI